MPPSFSKRKKDGAPRDQLNMVTGTQHCSNTSPVESGIKYSKTPMLSSCFSQSPPKSSLFSAVPKRWLSVQGKNLGFLLKNTIGDRSSSHSGQVAQS